MPKTRGDTKRKSKNTNKNKQQRSQAKQKGFSWVDDYYLQSIPISSLAERTNDGVAFATNTATTGDHAASPVYLLKSCGQDDSQEEGEEEAGENKGIHDDSDEGEVEDCVKNENDNTISCKLTEVKECNEAPTLQIEEDEDDVDPKEVFSVTTELTNLSINDAPATTTGSSSSKHYVRIASFNVLAEAYLTRRSHPGLPKPYADVVFNHLRRRKLLLDTIEKLFMLYDIICLQEVDLFDFIVKELNARRTKRSSTTQSDGGGTTNRTNQIPQFGYCHSEVFGRSDRCCIFYNMEKYTLIEHDVVEFDDLARIENVPSTTTTETVAATKVKGEETKENDPTANATKKEEGVGSDKSDCCTMTSPKQETALSLEKNDGDEQVEKKDDADDNNDYNSNNNGIDEQTTDSASINNTAKTTIQASNSHGNEGRVSNTKKESRGHRRRNIRASTSKNSSLSFNKPRNQRPSSIKQHSDESSTTSTTRSSTFTNHPLRGMVSSFRRRNAACIGVLQHNETKQPLVICSAHLFWNPGFEYVKLTQAKYLMERMHILATKYAGSSTIHPSSRGNTDKNDDENIAADSCDDDRRGGCECKNKDKHSNSPCLPPILICGDFNAQPGSAAHAFLSNGVFDARRVAPWHPRNIMVTTDDDDDDEVDDDNGDGIANTKDAYGNHINSSRSSGYTSGNAERNEVIANHLDLRYKIQQLAHEARKKTGRTSTVPSSYSPPNGTSDQERHGDGSAVVENPRYMLDYTLNKFTRWLRILGLDAALETVEEEQIRVQRVRYGGNGGGGRRDSTTTDTSIPMFEHCRNEGRVLLTTSYKILARKDCPPGAYLIDPRSLEDCLCHLLLLHGVILKPVNFLSRCVVCNGIIVEIVDENDVETYDDDDDGVQQQQETPTQENDEKRSLRYQILKANKAPVDLNVSIYACDFCLQCYWWSDKPNSAPSRVKAAVKELFTLLLKAGIPYEEPCGMFQECVDDVVKEENHDEHPQDADRNFNNEEEYQNHLDSLDDDASNDDRCTGHVNDGGAATNVITSTTSNDDSQTSFQKKSKSSALFPKVEALDWLKDAKLRHPFGRLQSVYATPMKDMSHNVDDDNDEGAGQEFINSNNSEMLPFTNVTSNFVGCLDYIFYQSQNQQQQQDHCYHKTLRLVERLNVPTTFCQLHPQPNNNDNIDQELLPNGHVLPSNIWPSDHLAIGATFELV